MSYLLMPLKTETLGLHNRLVFPPMATATADKDGKARSSIIDYYKEKAEGGYIGLIIIEHSYVSSSGKAGNNQLSICDNSTIDGLKKIASGIQKNGTKAIMQLSHAGSATTSEITGNVPVAPSPIKNPRKGDMPRELSLREINEIIEAFHDAAIRVKKSGFDGVEIHSAHGYLLNQFYSPLTNKRMDEYGGSLHNRIRIHLQIIESVRNAVGDDFPIFLRLGAADFTEGGTTLDDSITAAKEFEKAGADVLDISGGMCGYVVPGLTGQAYFSPLSIAVRKVVSVPVLLTGGITEVDTAESLLSKGAADLIGVGRAIYNDSKWAKYAIERAKAYL